MKHAIQSAQLDKLQELRSQFPDHEVQFIVSTDTLMDEYDYMVQSVDRVEECACWTDPDTGVSYAGDEEINDRVTMRVMDSWERGPGKELDEEISRVIREGSIRCICVYLEPA